MWGFLKRLARRRSDAPRVDDVPVERIDAAAEAVQQLKVQLAMLRARTDIQKRSDPDAGQYRHH